MPGNDEERRGESCVGRLAACAEARWSPIRRAGRNYANLTPPGKIDNVKPAGPVELRLRISETLQVSSQTFNPLAGDDN